MVVRYRLGKNRYGNNGLHNNGGDGERMGWGSGGDEVRVG